MILPGNWLVKSVTTSRFPLFQHCNKLNKAVLAENTSDANDAGYLWDLVAQVSLNSEGDSRTAGRTSHARAPQSDMHDSPVIHVNQFHVAAIQPNHGQKLVQDVGHALVECPLVSLLRRYTRTFGHEHRFRKKAPALLRDPGN